MSVAKWGFIREYMSWKWMVVITQASTTSWWNQIVNSCTFKHITSLIYVYVYYKFKQITSIKHVYYMLWFCSFHITWHTFHRFPCSGELKETKACEGLSIGDSVTFEVSVMVSECPADVGKRSRTFSIYPVGLSERLEISLDLICECDCEKPQQEVRTVVLVVYWRDST